MPTANDISHTHVQGQYTPTRVHEHVPGGVPTHTHTHILYTQRHETHNSALRCRCTKIHMCVSTQMSRQSVKEGIKNWFSCSLAVWLVSKRTLAVSVYIYICFWGHYQSVAVKYVTCRGWGRSERTSRVLCVQNAKADKPFIHNVRWKAEGRWQERRDSVRASNLCSASGSQKVDCISHQPHYFLSRLLCVFGYGSINCVFLSLVAKYGNPG